VNATAASTWVLDASIAIRWVFEDQALTSTDALLDRVVVDDVLVPNIWLVEVANVVLRTVREGRVPADRALGQINRLMGLPLIIEPGLTRSQAVSVAGYAAILGLKMADAVYLELAARKGLPLATMDRRLGEAARRMELSVLPVAET
jgi:predicted nucleic acid-binding protein